MAVVKDQGQEVLRKAAKDIGATPLTDYALQVFVVNSQSGGSSNGGPCGAVEQILTNGTFNALTDADGNILIAG